MNLDELQLLLVNYDDGNVYLVCNSYFSQIKHTALELTAPLGMPQGEGEDRTLSITLRARERSANEPPATTLEVLRPVTHVIDLGKDLFTISNTADGKEIDCWIEVEVLASSANDPHGLNASKVGPSRVKKVSAGGVVRPLDA